MILGKGIKGLKYQVKKGPRIIAQGTTDDKGAATPFNSEIGVPIILYVKRFGSDELKQIKTLAPWSEDFPVKLLSSKIKELVEFAEHEGPAGGYKRKTYIVQAGDTLGKIAQKNGTTPKALATLNGISVDGTIFPGQSLKLPSADPSPGTGSGGNASGASQGQSFGKPEKKPDIPAPVQTEGPIAPVETEKTDDRGENGTPKSTINPVCDQTGCIKLGDKGPLVEEINIRLSGFGGTIFSTAPMNEFTQKTENAVKQFQRDYMGAPETGRVCGPVLRALDDFLKKYPISLEKMKCECGKCDGFGSAATDSSKATMFKDAKNTPYPGVEYPGMHRSLLWAFRAALFYVSDKDKDLEYSFLRVSSGYRCWYNNAGFRSGVKKETTRKTTNHMGNALDLQFKKGAATKRCSGKDVDTLREKIFIERLGAQLGWPLTNKLSLERASDGATSWVHVDVRQFDDTYKSDRFYAVKQEYADGDNLVEIAKRDGRLNLIGCGGLSPKPDPQASDRLPVASLQVSSDGSKFIQAWEKCNLQPYDDSEGYCTIGWGHLIAKKSCSALAAEKNKDYEKYKNGISQPAADAEFEQNVQKTVAIVKKAVQVPLYQQEFDALVSLIFNIGGFSKCPKLLAKLNTKNYSGCCDEFADITNKGTVGLVKRRKAEMRIFRNNVYDASH